MTCKSCNPSATAGPAPYYEQVSREVTQEHQSVFASLCYAAGIIVPQAWVIADAGVDVVVTLTNVTYIPVGAYLYNPQYGYFKIAQWNPKSSTAGLINENITGTAAPGTSVPADTIFIVVAKPCCEDDTSTLFPFLAQNFIAPPVSQNLTIEVTSTFGLRLGDLVRIGTGVYRLNTILSSRQIAIYNEGAGIIPGTTVVARTPGGEYQYLIVSENASACSAPDVLQARLITCDGNLEKILRGRIIGQVPVLQSTTSNLVKFELLDADVRKCSELVASVNIIAGVLNYTIPVDGTSGFSVGNKVQINFNTLRFDITAIGLNSLNITATPAAPVTSFTIPPGAFVCRVLTSELLLQALSGAGAGLQSQITALTLTFATLSTGVTANNDASIARDNAEISLRTTNDATLLAAINLEVNARAGQDVAENAARIAADSSIISSYQAADAAEAGTRVSNDNNLQSSINSLNTLTSAYRIAQAAAISTPISVTNLNVDGTTVQGNDASVLIQNTSPTRNMVVLATISSTCNMAWDVPGATISTRLFELATELRTGAIGAVSFSAFDRNPQDITACTYTVPGVFRCDGVQVHARSTILTPGQEVRIRGRGVAGIMIKGGATELEVNVITTNIEAIAVAL